MCPNIASKKRTISRAPLSRTYFLSKGCKQVPLEYTRGIVRWAHPDGYFLRPTGLKAPHNFSPSAQRAASDHNRKMGKGYPVLCVEVQKYCHVLMALAFYGPRPTYVDKNGKEYVGICHHLIPDPLDYKPANLLCWLTKEEHAEADRRQGELIKTLLERFPSDTKETVLHRLTYTQLRELQDPRKLSRARFDLIIEKFDILTGAESPES